MHPTPEWKVRLKLKDGSVYVGGYLGWSDQAMYVVDELSGEVKQFDGSVIDDFDARKYRG